MSSFSDPRIVCRPALPSDSADVLEFTKFIWEGHDYIKYVWEEWLDDPQGILAAAQYGAHTVGIAKVTLLSSGQWWLEGLRVDPKYQGLGIGSHLHQYTDDWWLKHGDGMIRLMTSSERVQVHHLSERTGYAKVGEVAGYGFDLSAKSADTEGDLGSPLGTVTPRWPFEPVSSEALGPAVKFASAHLAHSNGLIDSGWRFSTPDAPVLREFAHGGHLHWWRGQRGLLGTFEDEDDGSRILAIAFAAVDELALMSALLRDAVDLARVQGFTAVHWLAPMHSSVQEALQDAGYIRRWEGTGFLYAKRHPQV